MQTNESSSTGEGSNAATLTALQIFRAPFRQTHPSGPSSSPEEQLAGLSIRRAPRSLWNRFRDDGPCPLCFNLDGEHSPHQRDGKISTKQRIELDYFADMGRQRKCPTCKMLVEGISKFRSVKPKDCLDSINVEIIANSEDGLIALVTGPDADLRLEYFTILVESPLSSMIKSKQPVPQDSHSDKTFASIKSWINECAETHVLCPSNTDVKLPRRLIDVSGTGDPRLHESYGETGCYIALSHRWGNNLITTTKDQLSSRLKRISWTELSRVFQDAIKITRNLDVQYLWIDSLCIIQDDIDDWLEQSAQMASIYAGALIVVAATDSENSDSTCLSDKDRPTSIRLSSPSMFVRKAIRHDEIFASQGNVSCYPLFNRAWCFQERLLATRILHYTHDEVVFECRTGYRCECNSIWRGNDEAVSGCLKLAYAQILQESRDLGRGDRYLGPTFSSLCKKETLLWHRVVGEYTKKQMTYERDTLPALSGVADRMPADLMGRYLAGLWEQDMVYSLLWRSEDGLQGRRHHVFTAPTFSWASRFGPITYPSFTSRFTAIATVLDARCVARDRNPTGEVLEGFVKLRGLLSMVNFHGVRDTSTDLTCAITRHGRHEEIEVKIDTLEDAESPLKAPAYCFSLLRYVSGGWATHMTVVLKACPNGLQRIGVADAVPSNWFDLSQTSDVTIF